jgi:hypothetical protein
LITWKQFLAANPPLAKLGEDQIFQYGVGLAFLATIRKDGAPRLHPVCPVISDSHLYILVLPESPKRWDLHRDGRYALQSFPEDRPDSDEFYISGKAFAVIDPEVFESVFTNAKHRASRDEILFELLLDRAMQTKWEGFGTEEYRPIHTKWIFGG